MALIKFFIERRSGAFVLADANGDLHVPAPFADEATALLMAVRFAQDQNALYSIYYGAPARQ